MLPTLTFSACRNLGIKNHSMTFVDALSIPKIPKDLMIYLIPPDHNNIITNIVRLFIKLLTFFFIFISHNYANPACTPTERHL